MVFILNNMLGSENFGLYNYVSAVIAVLIIALQFGFPLLLVRETQILKKQTILINKKYFNTILRSIVIHFSIIFVIYQILYDNLNHVPTIASSNYFSLIFLIALSSSVIAILTALIKVSGKPDIAYLLEFAPKNLVPLVIIIPFIILSKKVSVQGVLYLYLSGLIIFLCITIKKIMSLQPKVICKTIVKQNVYSTSFYLSINLVMFMLLRHVDILMLSNFVELSEVSDYRLSCLIFFTMQIPSSLMHMLLVPKIKKINFSKEKFDILSFRKLHKYVKILILSMIISTIVSVFGAYILFNILFDIYSFNNFILCRIIFGVFNLLITVFGFNNEVFSLNLHRREIMIVSFVTLIINVVGNILIIPNFGNMGAAFATGLSLLFYHIFLTVRLKQLKIKTLALI